MTFFCPACWSEIESSDSLCPKCAADVRALDGQSFAGKLCAALRHPEPQTAVRAAWILGERREPSAVPDLIRVLQSTQDSFLAEAAAEALGKIGDPMALPALKNAARLGTVRVRNASAQAVECIRAQERMQLLPEKKS
jgi:HEAT repeat protein